MPPDFIDPPNYGQHSPHPTLDRCYTPFAITLLVIFALGSISVGYTYYFGLFAVAIGFAICNLVAGRHNRLGTSPWDLIILVLSIVSLIPVLGWITQMAGLAFTIVVLSQKRQT